MKGDDNSGGISVVLFAPMSTMGSDQIVDDTFLVADGDVTETQRAPPEATLFLPGDLIDSVNVSTRMVIIAYLDSSLFQSQELLALNQNQTEFNRTLNSRIISASFGQKKIENLKTPVRVTFEPLIGVR